jgi:hypothetical protein
LLALSATVAAAGTCNLYWNDCVGNGGVTNKNFACGSNAGSNAAAGSFILTTGMTDFVAVEIVMDLEAENPVVPDWWVFSPQAGACRGSALSITFDFSVFANVNAACTDPFNAVAQGGLANYTVTGARARIIGVGAVASEGAQVVVPATEYYGFRLSINNTKSTGVGSCAGCNIPVAVVLNSLKAVGLAAASVEDNFTAAQSQCITWQSAGPATCLATPVQNRTWGQVKSLYR